MKNRKVEKLIKKELRAMEAEKKNCKKLYPDWRDDEYNMLHNRFIWGYSKRSKETSFETLNEVTIYYNREYKIYYLNIDLSEYSDMGDKCDILVEAFRSLHDYVTGGYELSHCACHSYSEMTDSMFELRDFYECCTLAEAYFKLRILTIGLAKYWQDGDNMLESDIY